MLSLVGDYDSDATTSSDEDSIAKDRTDQDGSIVMSVFFNFLYASRITKLN